MMTPLNRSALLATVASAAFVGGGVGPSATCYAFVPSTTTDSSASSSSFRRRSSTTAAFLVGMGEPNFGGDSRENLRDLFSTTPPSPSPPSPPPPPPAAASQTTPAVPLDKAVEPDQAEPSHVTAVEEKSPSSTTVAAAAAVASPLEVEGAGEDGIQDDGGSDDGREPGVEWHVASTTPQLLSALWCMIVQGSGMQRGESMTIEFPNMEKEFTPSYLNRLTGHLDTCKDVCDDFGISTVIMPYSRPGDPPNKVAGFTVKSYRNPEKLDADGQPLFDPDPFWDILTDDDFSYIQELAADDEDDEAGDLGVDESELPEIETLIPDDDDEIVQVTRRWVDKMMSDLALCPFTNGPDLSGMPMGKVFYTVDRCKTMEEMYASYWKEVVRVEQSDEKELSTTLLIAPEFCMDNIEAYENFCNTLTQPLEVLNVEDLLQLVFFHPKWTFRDGGERSGSAGAANYARRSPWPMVNILRTNQVRAAQKGIPTGLVYKQNEKTLGKIGTKRLETMLRLRDWMDVRDEKVDRREMEALRVAKDLQTTGIVAQEDMSVTADATPAANKVDQGHIEGADLLNVLLQALDKRLHGGPDGGVERLSGPETSAAMMASDFLLQRANEV